MNSNCIESNRGIDDTPKITSGGQMFKRYVRNAVDCHDGTAREYGAEDLIFKIMMLIAHNYTGTKRFARSNYAQCMSLPSRIGKEGVHEGVGATAPPHQYTYICIYM
jgi:hypothetical protein